MVEHPGPGVSKVHRVNKVHGANLAPRVVRGPRVRQDLKVNKAFPVFRETTEKPGKLDLRVHRALPVQLVSLVRGASQPMEASQAIEAYWVPVPDWSTALAVTGLYVQPARRASSIQSPAHRRII